VEELQAQKANLESKYYENMASSSKSIAVDVTQASCLRSLAAICSSKSKKFRVKSVQLFRKNSSCPWQEEDLTPEGMLAVFSLLARLSNLEYLTIDLDDRTLPLQSLVVLLEGTKQLRELQLRHVCLPGKPSQDLQKAMEGHTSLEKVSMLEVRGSPVVQTFMMYLPKLRSLELVGTKISSAAGLTSAVLIATCQSPCLREIRLEDIPDLIDLHIVALAKFLQKSPEKTHLRKFHLSSVSVGDVAGSAITDLLLTTKFLRQVTLDLGSWEQSGNSASQVLTHNTTLTHLQVSVTGQLQAAVDQKVVEIFSALKTNRHLKSLRLGLNNDEAPVVSIDPLVLETLELALDTNHTLEALTLVDDCDGPVSLPYSITSKLDQNRAGLSRLLHEPCQNFHVPYMENIIQNKDSLDLVFFALSNHPMVLFSSAAESQQQQQEGALSVASNMIPSSSSSKKRLLSPKTIQRGVRRLATGRWGRV
jgi:hypothetical protein